MTKENRQAVSGAAEPSGKRHEYVRKILGVVGGILLVATVAAGIFVFWALRTSPGQEWLTAQVNRLLEKALEAEGLVVRIGRISGELPFTLNFAVEVSDRDGVWLEAPENRFAWAWRDLPGAIHIQTISFRNVRLKRLPFLPSANTESKREQPFDLAKLQTQLADVSRLLQKPPSWLPAVYIDGIELSGAAVSQAILNGESESDKNSFLLANAKGVIFCDARGLKKCDDMPTGQFPDPEKKNALASIKFDVSGTDGSVGISNIEFSCISSNLVFLLGQNGEEIISSGSAILEVQSPKLNRPGLPEDLLGKKATASLAFSAQAVVPDSGPLTQVALGMEGPTLHLGPISMEGSAKWTSINAIWPQGPLSLNYKLALDAAAIPAPADHDHAIAELARVISKPAKIIIDISGDLPKLSLNFAAAVPQAVFSGQEINDLKVDIKSSSLIVPVDGRFHLPSEISANVDLEGRLGGESFGMSTECHFFSGGETRDAQVDALSSSIRAGFKDFRLWAFGLEGQGSMDAIIAEGKVPIITGGLHVQSQDLAPLAQFLPQKNLSGQAVLDIVFNVGADSGGNSGFQNGTVDMRLKNFRYGEQSGDAVLAIANLRGKALLKDFLGDGNFIADLEASGIRSSEYLLNSKIKASGPFKGPINASVWSSGSLDSRLEAEWIPGQLSVRKLVASLSLSAPGKKKEKLGVKAMRPLRVTYGDSGIAIDGLDMRITPNGRILADGGISKEHIALKFSLDELPLNSWRDLVPSLPKGNITAHVNLSGSPSSPAGRFHIGLDKIQMPGIAIEPLSMSLNGRIENVTGKSCLTAALAMDEKSVKALGGSRADFNIRIPLVFTQNGLPRVDMGGNIAGYVGWAGAIGPIWRLVPLDGRRLNGRLEIDVKIAGKVASPAVNGSVSISGARYEDILLGVLLNDINMKLNLVGISSGRVRAKKGFDIPGSMNFVLTAADGLGGSMRVSGAGSLDGEKIDITAALDHLRPLRRRDIQINLSGDAKVSGSAFAPDIIGKILINQGEILLDNLAVGSSVTTLPISVPKSGGKSEKGKLSAPIRNAEKAAPKGSINMRIQSPGRFIVEGRGLTSEWQANLLVTGSPFAPAITGQISAVKGNFDFLGKNFILSRGIVSFAGGSLANPLLNIVLTNHAPDLVAHINITGPVNKIKLTMTSEPALPRDEILSRVLFGKSVNELGRLEALQMAAAVAQLAGFSTTGGILNSAKKALGVDVLRLGTSPTGAAGQPGDETAGGTTLEMGKYINDMIYMGVQQGMKPDSTAFIIQLELTPRTSLELRTEQQNTWGGLKWKYNY